MRRIRAALGYRFGYGNSTEVPMSEWNEEQAAGRTVYTDYGDQYSPYGYKVQARDCAGNKRSKFVSFDADVEQETVSSSYTGNWGLSATGAASCGQIKESRHEGQASRRDPRGAALTD